MRRVVLLNKCLAAGMLLLLLHSFITALLVGTMVGWYVCTRGRQFVDVCCFCIKGYVCGILYVYICICLCVDVYVYVCMCIYEASIFSFRSVIRSFYSRLPVLFIVFSP